MVRMEVKRMRADAMEDVVSKLKAFVENEMRSCSMDYGCVTPMYVYRMLGGTISYEDIQAGLARIRTEGQEGQVSVSQWREDTSRAA